MCIYRYTCIYHLPQHSLSCTRVEEAHVCGGVGGGCCVRAHFGRLLEV